MEGLLLNRLSSFVEEHLINQQSWIFSWQINNGLAFKCNSIYRGWIPGKKITGAVFVDLAAAYDTVNHRRLLAKILKTTKDPLLTKFLGVMLRNRRFFAEFNNKKSRVRLQRNGLPQGSVLAPLSYNIYSNDQLQDLRTKRFIYADDLCITCLDTRFDHV